MTPVGRTLRVSPLAVDPPHKYCMKQKLVAEQALVCLREGGSVKWVVWKMQMSARKCIPGDEWIPQQTVKDECAGGRRADGWRLNRSTFQPDGQMFKRRPGLSLFQEMTPNLRPHWYHPQLLHSKSQKSKKKSRRWSLLQFLQIIIMRNTEVNFGLVLLLRVEKHWPQFLASRLDRL